MNAELLYKLKSKDGRIKWQFVKNLTYNFYLTDIIFKQPAATMLGVRFYLQRGKMFNSYGFSIEIGIILFTINFWLKWGFYKVENVPEKSGGSQVM